MKKPLAKIIPLLVRSIVPGAAVASSVLSPPALGATGDLDQTFGNLGRVGPMINLDGPAWALQDKGNGSIIIAGGDEDCTGYNCYYAEYDDATEFVEQLTGTGTIDSSFDAISLQHTQVFDVVLQPDGKVVAVGREIEGRSRFNFRLTVFRLESSGALDRTFGDDGIVRLPIQSMPHVATSVALDPDGRIIVAGASGGELLVLRLLANGSFDNSFGVSGLFSGSRVDDWRGIRVLRTASSGYRVASGYPCQIVALTAAGAIDQTFGSAGIAADTCGLIVALADDRLLVAGSANGQVFATRLLPNGVRDPNFSTTVVDDTMTSATALAVGANGSIFVAGNSHGVSGAAIMRLQADGELDLAFGNEGSTWIDLPSADGTFPSIKEVIVGSSGRVTAAGGVYANGRLRPVVIRLVGDGGGGNPGILGVMRPSISVAEQSQQAVITVRRMGGRSGNVSVGYQTAAAGPTPASGGQDYTELGGRLTWQDGDSTDRQIVVPISSNDSSPEEHEYFAVALSDVQGGADLGTHNATVEIRGEGEPFGQFAVVPERAAYGESDGFAQVSVQRNFYSSGAVSVTVTPIAGSATAGDDFDPQPIVLSWNDGEYWPKQASIAIRDDSIEEQSETFTVELSNPTGGAIVGPRSSISIAITASDGPPPPPPPPNPGGNGGGGGGALGFLSLLLLGAASCKRRSLES